MFRGALQAGQRSVEQAAENVQPLSKSALKRLRKKRARLKAGSDAGRTPTSASPAVTKSSNDNRRTKGPLVTARAPPPGRGAKGGNTSRDAGLKASAVAAPSTPGSATKGNAAVGSSKTARRQRGAGQLAAPLDTDTRTRKQKKSSGEVSDRLDELVAQYQAKLFGGRAS